MFEDCTSLEKFEAKDQPDFSEMYYMSGTFNGASKFNQDLNDWDVSKVSSMHGVFQDASSVNQDISGWNTEKVLRMHFMFQGARSFNQDLSGWKVDNVYNFSNFASQSPLTCDHTPRFDGKDPATTNASCRK